MSHAFPELPRESIEPEIERLMTIPRMDDMRGKFKPHVKEQDLEDFDKRDRRLLLAVSVLDQKVDYYGHWLMISNRHQRLLEAEHIRQRRAQMEINWRWTILRWLGIVAASSILAGFAREWVQRLWQ